MIEADQKWELFGYDTRQVGRHWTAAWRDLLLGYDSPVRRRLDDVVSLRAESGSACYQAGNGCPYSVAQQTRGVEGREPDIEAVRLLDHDRVSNHLLDAVFPVVAGPAIAVFLEHGVDRHAGAEGAECALEHVGDVGLSADDRAREGRADDPSRGEVLVGLR